MSTTSADATRTADEIREEAREAGEQKRHELVTATDVDADIKERATQINDAVQQAIEAKLHDGIENADTTPKKIAGEAIDSVDAVVSEWADRIMDDWAISMAELSTRLENRG